MTIVLILVFAGLFGLIGGAVEGDDGFIFGALLGILSGLYGGLRIKFGRLERRVADSERALEILANVDLRASASDSSAQAGTEPAMQAAAMAEIPVAAAPDATPLDSEPGGPAVAAEAPETTEPAGDPWLDGTPDDLVRPPGAAMADKLWATVKSFFTTGNIVVKVGLVVLFFGVSFLIKYASERELLPIEFRLAGIAVVGIVLLVVGWKLRTRNPGYAMVLQGGAIGILYLTVFGAARLYHILPLGLAFAMMIGFVLLSGALAVLQNAPALAAFGSAGGFLAPVLTSTGEGSHVALFSYYACLNLGIFGVAWFKAWRGLNWLGFVFTFVIATAWGARYYTQAHFASSEPFLILFMLFYIAITVLFATRQPPRLRGLVDASLVFGVPTVGFARAFYAVLAFILWRCYRDDMRLLCESFLALGVVFVSLAIPLALDGHWTAAAWSLEAVGIIWIGLRQDRLAARAFGLLLQIGAAVLFLLHGDLQTTAPAVINSAYIGSIMIAVAGLLSAYLYARYAVVTRPYEDILEYIFLAWGLVWWVGAGVNEISDHVVQPNHIAALIAFTGLSAVGLSGVARRLQWHCASLPAIALLPVLALLAGTDFAAHADHGPFRAPYALAWVVGIVANYALLAGFAGTWGQKRRELWHAGSAWLLIFLITWAAAVWVDQSTQLSAAWVFAITGFVPAAVVVLLVRWGGRVEWPCAAFADSYQRIGLAPIIAFLACWIVASASQAGDPGPLSYVPVLNPVEATGMVALISLVPWWVAGRNTSGMCNLMTRHVIIGLSVLCFIWFNAVLFRVTHHTTGTPYEFSLMWHSPALQTTISLAWTLLGSALMALAALKLKLREVWIVGAVILGLVVVKLFTVDLADIGTVARIVSFMGVGLILLLIGYFAPLPPQPEVRE